MTAASRSDWSEEEVRVRDAHHVVLAYHAVDGEGGTMFGSNLILTPAEAEAMFRDFRRRADDQL